MLPATKIPEALVKYIRRRLRADRTVRHSKIKTQDRLPDIIGLLRGKAGMIGVFRHETSAVPARCK